MATTVLTKRGYARLLKDVGTLIAAGRREAEAAAGHVLAVTYWKVGERIGREALSERAGYGQGMVEQLADELGMARTTLVRALRFARLYEAPPAPGLSWAHYQELLTVADPEARAFYQGRALSEGWSRKALRTAIAGRVFVDGEVAEAGTKARLPRPEDGSYLYRCEVLRVIDGDTLLVHVDLGFEVIKLQRLRLWGVDVAPERTRAGREASQWVREQLARAQQVVLRTQKASDVHGRYVAHVFYSGDADATAEEVFRTGEYLNGRLVREGHAAVA